MTAGNKKYTLYSFTGRVHGMGKDFVMYTFSQSPKSCTSKKGEWNPTVRVETTTNAFNHVFLKASNGDEHSFTFHGWNIALREGHEMTVTWAIRKGEERGPHIAIRNNTTLQVYFSDKELARLFRLTILYQAFLPALCMSVAYLIYPRFITVAIFFIAGVVASQLIDYLRKKAKVQAFKRGFRQTRIGKMPTPTME